jgi:hypothetical protein
MRVAAMLLHCYGFASCLLAAVAAAATLLFEMLMLIR